MKIQPYQQELIDKLDYLNKHEGAKIIIKPRCHGRTLALQQYKELINKLTDNTKLSS